MIETQHLMEEFANDPSAYSTLLYTEWLEQQLVKARKSARKARKDVARMDWLSAKHGPEHHLESKAEWLIGRFWIWRLRIFHEAAQSGKPDSLRKAIDWTMEEAAHE